MPADGASAAALPAYSGVYVFGDSLVDPGNDLKAAQALGSLPFADLPNGAPTADKGYYFGRFSNGFNFADLISNKLVHQPTEATFPYGASNAFTGISTGPLGRPDGNNLSFAYGGATAVQPQAPIPDLHTEVGIYQNYNVNPNALYIISIGANDILSLVPTGGTPTTGSAADARISAAASEVAQEVGALYARGALHVVVADVADLSVTPAYAGAQDEATRRSLLAQYAQSFDQMLRADLNGLSTPAGASVLDYSTFNYTDAVAANPSRYGFSNVTQALITAQPNAPDPTGDGFLFFDKLHPTAQAHAQIASEILDALANPGQPLNWTPAASIGAQATSIAPQGGVSDFTASLTAGKTYVVDVLGISSGVGTLADPYVRVLDGSGAVVAQDDDGGLGLDSHLQFTVPTSGDYTVEVSGVGVTTGTYRLQLGEAAGANLLTSGALRGSNVAVTGGASDDTITALAGANTLFGGDGADSITGGSGFDRINGNQGADTANGGDGNDWVLGGQGNDLLSGGAGNDIVNGNLGNDTVDGGIGDDTLRGGQGDDVLTGGAGNDHLLGDRGADTLTGGPGADVFHVGPGSGADRVTDFNAAEGDRVDVAAGSTYATTQQGADTVVDLGGGDQLILQGVTANTLPSGWIFVG